MDIRIVRVLKMTAMQQHDAADGLLKGHLQVLELLGSGQISASSNAEAKAQAEEAIPALREAMKHAIECLDALTEIIAKHKAAIASIDALPSTVTPPDGPGDDGGQKH